jgi:hypothetical protein
VIAIEVDQPKNLLVIRYRGAIASAELERGLEEVRAALAILTTGFRLLGDLTELQSMEVSCAPFLERIMDLCNKKGVTTVVRVIPDPHLDIGLQIMSIFHYGSTVRIVTCETLANAFKALES